MDELAPKVAERFARSRARLDNRLKADINTSLRKAGFDGRGRWQKIGQALSAAFDVLAKHGLEQDETLNAHLFREPSGTRSIEVAFTNEEDSFSPISISNSVVHFSWTELRERHIEVIAYMS